MKRGLRLQAASTSAKAARSAADGVRPAAAARSLEPPPARRRRAPRCARTKRGRATSDGATASGSSGAGGRAGSRACQYSARPAVAVAALGGARRQHVVAEGELERRRLEVRVAVEARPSRANRTLQLQASPIRRSRLTWRRTGAAREPHRTEARTAARGRPAAPGATSPRAAPGPPPRRPQAGPPRQVDHRDPVARHPRQDALAAVLPDHRAQHVVAVDQPPEGALAAAEVETLVPRARSRGGWRRCPARRRRLRPIQ